MMLQPKDKHKENRESLYGKITDFWHNLFGEPYALYDIKVLSKNEVLEIRDITEKIGKIYFKMANLLRNVDDQTLLEIGIPQKTLSFVRLKTINPESVIARIDLVKTNKGYKHVEINADTPTFIKELFEVNGVVASHFSLQNPNEGMNKMLGKVIKNAIFDSYAMLGSVHFPHIVFTSHHDHEEDWYTTKYLADISGLPCSCIPLHQLNIVEGEGLYDQEGKKIDVLYRQTYPIEHLMEDEDEVSGDEVGMALLKLVEEKKLAILNPPSAFLLQSKAVQAVIWGLHEEQHPYFTEEEHQWIESYFLPTYLEEEIFIQKGEKYVKKPSFGREGDTVEIYDSFGEKVLEDKQKNYQDSLPVYQQYIELPTHMIQTEDGPKEAHLLLGSFLIEGKAGAIGYRAGNQITGNESAFLPVGMK